MHAPSDRLLPELNSNSRQQRRRHAFGGTWIFDDDLTVTDCAPRIQIEAQQSNLLARVLPRQPHQRIPHRLRARTIQYLETGMHAIITHLMCQGCGAIRHAENFPTRSMRRAQYSLLHSLWPGYVRRTDRSIWCRQCAVTEQLMLGNLPDGYCIRIRATLEFCHQERVAARLFAVHNSNHLGEHIALNADMASDVARQLERYWYCAESSDGQDDMFHSDHVSTDDDPRFVPGGPGDAP